MQSDNSQVVDMKYLQTVNKQINITFLKKCLAQNKTIPIEFVKDIIYRFQKIIQNQPNVLNKSQPVTIIGDIHGQFRDLLKILSLCPPLDDNPKHSLLFLGDYVDRGPFGMEVIILLMAMKITYKNNIYLLRGNHQSRQMTQCFNFFNQACQKYNQQIYYQIMDMFDFLPLACIIDNKYFCVHGGISNKAMQVQMINKEKRNIQIPLEGILCDLMWSDPTQNPEGKLNQPFQSNHLRNCSILFGQELGQTFLKKNKFLTIIRGHQVQMQGFKEHIWPGWNNIPTVYTIFSAPNYCGTYHNKGSILTINQDFKIRQFKQQDPKYFVPEKFNAFNFSANRLIDFIDKFYKKLAKSKVKQIPQLKQLSAQQIIGLLFQYATDTKVNPQNYSQKLINKQKYNNIKKQQENKNNSNKNSQQLQISSLYSKIKDYYKNSQKRSNSGKILIGKNKVQQLK